MRLHPPTPDGQSPFLQGSLRLQCVLLLLVAGLCAGIAAEGASLAVAQELPAAGESIAPDPLLNPNPLSAIDPATLTGFRDRPLFSPSRTRPPDPVAEPVPEATEPVTEQPREPVTLQLLGVIGTPDGIRALVRDESDDTRHVLQKGDVFRGWSVVSVDVGEMVLDRDGEMTRFPTFKPSEVEPSGSVPGSETEPAQELEGSGTTP